MMLGVTVDFCFSSLKPTASVPNPAIWVNSPALDIRTLQIQDLRMVTEVLANSFHSSQGWSYWLFPLIKLGIYEDLRHRLRQANPNYQCIVARYGQEPIIGTAEMSLRPSIGFTAFPYLSNLAVSLTHRRRGTARQLLRRCEQIALDWGYDVLFLHVLEDNTAAQKLYEANGYQLCREEWCLSDWLFHRSRRLLLSKKLRS